MFDFVHENKKLVQIVLAVIILPFAFWGIESYTHQGNSADVVAKVDGAKITQQEFDNALRQQQDRLRQQLGGKVDVSMFDNPAMKRMVLENLVMQRLLIERARKAGLLVTDEQMAQVIGGIEDFRVDGKFDKKRYEAALSARNLTPLRFEANVRDELLGMQLQDAYTQNGFAPASVADNIIRLEEQQRVVRVYSLLPQAFLSQAEVGDADLKDYYEKNKKEFQVQEQVRVEYVKFSVSDLLSKTEISKDDARRYYDEHQNEFGTPEERQARGDIVNKLRQQKAADLYAELADKFSNTVYEQSDTLKPAAALVSAKIEQSGWLSRGEAPGEPWTAKMLQAIFSDETMKGKRNTAAIEVAPNTLLAARIIEHKPAAERQLGEVRELIRQRLLQQKAAELAVKQGKAMLEQLRGGNGLKVNWSTTETVTRGKRGSLDAGLVRQVFQVNAANLPQYVGAEMGMNGYKLVRVDAVKEGGAITEAAHAQYLKRLRQMTGEELFKAYLAEARQRAAIEINLRETAQP